MSEVLVFGASGFIGKYLVESLGKKDVGIIAVDIRSPMAGIENTPKADAIVNLACVQPARGMFSPQDYIDVNIKGLDNILDSARKEGIKKVISVFSQKEKRSGEMGKFNICEQCAMGWMEWYHSEFGLQTISLRIPVAYGYGPNLEGTGLKTFIDRAIDGKPLEVWGDASLERNVIDVRDVVAIIKYLIESDYQGIMTVEGIWLSLKKEVQIVNKVFNNKNSIIYRPDISNGIEEPSLDFCNLAWKPRYSFIDTVREIKRRMEV